MNLFGNNAFVEVNRAIRRYWFRVGPKSKFNGIVLVNGEGDIKEVMPCEEDGGRDQSDSAVSPRMSRTAGSHQNLGRTRKNSS